jgi:alkylhydroperoxidase family enzyme
MTLRQAKSAKSTFEGSGYRIREDLAESHRLAWERIGAPGTWLTAARRVAVAAEVRQARGCALCRAIKEALSPSGPKGSHVHLGALSAPEIELIHRAVSDSGRLSEKWSQSVLAGGLSEGEYVEIVGIVAMVSIMDTCTLALGLPDQPLPAPLEGEPARYLPPGARKKACWLPIVEPPDAVDADGPMYPSPRAGYIYRGLSMVPQSLRDYWALANNHYLPGSVIYQFDKTIRAITRPQTELLAARVSAMHQCAY